MQNVYAFLQDVNSGCNIRIHTFSRPMFKNCIVFYTVVLLL